MTEVLNIDFEICSIVKSLSCRHQQFLPKNKKRRSRRKTRSSRRIKYVWPHHQARMIIYKCWSLISLRMSSSKSTTLTRRTRASRTTRLAGVVLQKLGWGHFSTVWLAKDFKYDNYVALKIQKSAPHYLEASYD
jgi:hypothetical protein